MGIETSGILRRLNRDGYTEVPGFHKKLIISLEICMMKTKDLAPAGSSSVYRAVFSMDFNTAAGDVVEKRKVNTLLTGGNKILTAGPRRTGRETCHLQASIIKHSIYRNLL